MTSLEIRQAIRQKFAWPGGYEIFLITSDGAALCCACARENYRQIAWSRRFNCHDGWKVEAADIDANLNNAIYCDHCSKQIGEDWE